MSRKGYDRVPWPFVFVRTPLPISAFKPSSGVASGNCQCHPSSHNTHVDKGTPGATHNSFSLESFLTDQEAEGRAC